MLFLNKIGFLSHVIDHQTTGGRSLEGYRYIQQDGTNRETQDPYVIFTVGSESKRTSTAQNQGKKPAWKDALAFTQKAETLKITVMDEDVTTDDMIGEGTFNITGAFSHPGVPKTCKICGNLVPIDVYYKNKPAGKILVTV